MKSALVALSTLFFIGGCSTYDIQPVDASEYESQCVSQCAENYSECTANNPDVELQETTLRACQEDYSDCVQACPRGDTP
ncbi:hypothetical protein SAMN06297229_1155 [Pseudidiomarina planktonica]|uniref:Uncharacterized protein n=1 Tax=Pseudidiomarina planktonica TaxID=1323738 RepID=A0A1Y6EXJ2_9GAMM|nr:hypothetical protein [Pseudidiomarina planktonica]RUO65440.1 hypothetical protein CWI77_02990 [Pseudidiomarina planktonica]SMQ64993.1 hypothetical protein SAMN06297229_1155 [Pseudidiomarina planktonica]